MKTKRYSDLCDLFCQWLQNQSPVFQSKKLRGMQGVVCIDEAAFHEKLAEVLKAALALTMWGAKVC